MWRQRDQGHLQLEASLDNIRPCPKPNQPNNNKLQTNVFYVLMHPEIEVLPSQRAQQGLLAEFCIGLTITVSKIDLTLGKEEKMTPNLK